MKKTFKLSLLALFLATNIFASECEDSRFDKTVYEDNIVEQEALLGFGGQRVLEIIRDEHIRDAYETLVKLAGSTPEVSVQKLPSKNEDHLSKRTVYTFRGWAHKGFTPKELIATLKVESYSNIRTGCPSSDQYERAPIILDMNSFVAENLLNNEAVKEKYNEISSTDDMRIIVLKILPARNENESEITRYSIENLVGERVNLSFEVEAYTNLNTGERKYVVEGIKVGYPWIGHP